MMNFYKMKETESDIEFNIVAKSDKSESNDEKTSNNDAIGNHWNANNGKNAVCIHFVRFRYRMRL